MLLKKHTHNTCERLAASASADLPRQAHGQLLHLTSPVARCSYCSLHLDFVSNTCNTRGCEPAYLGLHCVAANGDFTLALTGVLLTKTLARQLASADLLANAARTRSSHTGPRSSFVSDCRPSSSASQVEQKRPPAFRLSRRQGQQARTLTIVTAAECLSTTTAAHSDTDCDLEVRAAKL